MAHSRGTATRQQLTATADTLQDHVLLRKSERERLQQIRRSLARHTDVVETAEIIAYLTGLHQVLDERSRGQRVLQAGNGEAAVQDIDECADPPLLEAAGRTSRKRARDLHRLIRILFGSVILTAAATLWLVSVAGSLGLAGAIGSTGLAAMIAELAACMMALLPYQTAVASADYMDQTAAAFAVIGTGRHGNADLASALLPQTRDLGSTVLTAQDIPAILQPLVSLSERFSTRPTRPDSANPNSEEGRHEGRSEPE